jgi:hypothetical protein
MQSTGHSSMQDLSFTSMHGSAITYVTGCLQKIYQVAYGGNSNSYSGRCAIFADSVYRSVMPTELETTFASLIGKRVSIRLHDPEGGFRDIVGFLETPYSLRNRLGKEIEFTHEQIFIWREVIERK